VSARKRLEFQGIGLPPLPPGAIGWNVYNSLPAEPVFAGFVGDEEAVSRVAEHLADEVEAFAAGEADE
jgi:hypothetical protein